MKNNSEGKRNKHLNKLPEIAGRIASALSARAKRIGIVKLAAFSVLGILLISAASVFIWMFFIRAHKTAETYERHYSWPSENALKGIILEDPEPFSGNDYFAFNFDNCVTNFVFTDYFAYDAVEIPGPIRSIRFMQKYFEGTLGECDEDGFPPYVIIGIDPYQTYLQSCSNKELFQKNLAFIADSASAHPDSKYCIILPDDSYYKWNMLSDEEKKEARLSYILLVRYFTGLTNLNVYYYSLEDWVLYSSCIRSGGPDSPVLSETYDHLLALDVFDQADNFILTKENVNDYLDDVIERSGEYASISEDFTDLSGKSVFFLGDSIFGNFRNETSVPSFFREMTGARVYNLGEGGMSAVQVANENHPLNSAFRHLTGNLDRVSFDAAFSGYHSYGDFGLAAHALEGTAGENCIFIVEYGLNDYFGGIEAARYADALYMILTELKATYPAARIVVLSPGFIGMYEYGNESIGEYGGILDEYREAAAQTASACGCEFLSQTEDFGFTQEDYRTYLQEDTVHYNEIGRYRLALGLARNL